MRVFGGMVVWNRALFVGRTARLLAAMTEEFTLWDNASTDTETLRVLDHLEASGMTVYRSPQNVGIDGAYAELHRQAFERGADVVVCQEDGLLLVPWAVDVWRETLAAWPEIGIAGSSLTHGQDYLVYEPDRVPQEGVKEAIRALAGGENVPRFAPYPVRWNTTWDPDPGCYALTRDCWEATGGVDLLFFQGWRTMVDFSRRARDVDYMAVVVWDALALSLDRMATDRYWCLGEEFERNMRRWQEIGHNRLEEKWGRNAVEMANRGYRRHSVLTGSAEDRLREESA